MILRILEAIIILYCSLSYLGAACYVVWHTLKYEDWKSGDIPNKIAVGFFFTVLGPLLVADVIWERLTGNRGIL